jgi:hypothetical protein
VRLVSRSLSHAGSWGMGADGSSSLRSIGAGDIHTSERVDGWTTDENCLADGTDTSFFILVEICKNYWQYLYLQINLL